MSSQEQPERRIYAHGILGHPTIPDTVLYAPEKPWEAWTPHPPGMRKFHDNDSRQSDITLEVSMRDIIYHSKESSPSERRYSSDSTRTANDQDPNNYDYGSEKGEKSLPPPPPIPVGFWDRSLAKTRKEIVKGWLKISQY